jgi:DNA-binding response OmpR family regulator
MLTARDQAASEGMSKAQGADLCLTKPFNPMEISRIVKEMLADQP